MRRTDTPVRVISAPPDRVVAALTDSDALAGPAYAIGFRLRRAPAISLTAPGDSAARAINSESDRAGVPHYVTFEVGGKRSRRVPATLSSAPAMCHTATRSATQAPGCFSCLPPAASRTGQGDSDPALSRALPRPTVRCPMPDEERMMAAQAAAGCAPVG